MRQTWRSGFSESRAATTHPAVPPPTTATSTLIRRAYDGPNERRTRTVGRTLRQGAGGYARQVESLTTLSRGTRAWFERAFGTPTPAQELAWPAIAAGGDVLVQAPTGSGKTLAAFLLGLDRLNETPGQGLRLLYVSPLKALNYDVERNLRGPLAGIRSTLSVGVRTGDTPQRDRERMLRTPPDILITTPESLFLLLTSRGRELLKTVETVILDEVHAVAGTKRGAHLALSLERLERVVEQPFQRIGLSATQRPLAEIGRWVAGPGREIALVDAGQRKELDLEVVVPVEDMRELGASSRPLSQPVVQDGVEMDPGYEATSRSIWPSMYPALLELVRAHRSTIVFVNNRRLAERLALRINELADIRPVATQEFGQCSSWVSIHFELADHNPRDLADCLWSLEQSDLQAIRDPMAS